MTAPVPLLSIDRLSVDFKTRAGTVHALKGVSFDVSKGEMLGVVGESGSGKSVTAFNVMGILDPAGRSVGDGRAIFGGLDLLSAQESALREIRGREMSMIFQNPRVALNPIRPVGRQIEDVLAQHTTVLRTQRRERAIAMLEQVRIREPERRYHAYPYELSGGMCQRVMIAIALACEPSLLIADEPTTGLDVTTQKTIMDLIRDLAGERQMATILITHDLGLAAHYCQRIVVMQKGEVVEAGETAALFRNPQHAYTKKLIAATPRRHSVLADLSDAPGLTQPVVERKIQPEGSRAPLLDVVDLVKEFPLQAPAGTVSRIAAALRRRVTREPIEETRRNVFRAVDGIRFHVMPGESVGLVGESGCGKSTTSNMITRLMDPTSGNILFKGRDLTEYPARVFASRPERRLIQMVFQDPTESLNPRFPAFDCIADPIRRLGEEDDRKHLSDRVGGLAEMVGLPTEFLSRFPHQLSGGQKARVGIARAIALRPELLILDEPTSALDVSVQAIVLNLLDRLRRELGMSYVFVSHDLNVVRLLCSRVIVMNNGRIVEQGDAEELLSHPSDPYTRNLIEAVPHFSGQNDCRSARDG